MKSISKFTLFVFAFLTLAATSFNASAATPAPLPPAAQDALNKGIIAAKVPDYLLAIRYFEEARKLAPQAPVIYLNMGLAESRMPGRELRAIAWFGAYLAAYHDAPNTAAVNEQIAALNVRNQGNTSRFLKTVQNAARQISGIKQEAAQSDLYLFGVATLWLDSGDMTAALESANLIQDAELKGKAQSNIAEAQARSGDVAGAQTTADQNQVARYKCLALISIAEAKVIKGDLAGAITTLAVAQKTVDLIDSEPKANDPFRISIKNGWAKSHTRALIATGQANAGDISGAQQTTDLIHNQHAYFKCVAQTAIAEAQIRAGDSAGARKTLASAQKTADLIDDTSSKSTTQRSIGEALTKIGFANIAYPTRQSTSATQPRIKPAITVSNWLSRLDDDNMSNDCPLNTGPFLNLAGYLESVAPPDNVSPSHTSGVFFNSLYETAKIIVKAQNVITGMLK